MTREAAALMEPVLQAPPPDRRISPRRGLRRVLVAVLVAATAFEAAALDEIILENGRRYLGRIVADTPHSILVSIDGGTVEFPRSAVRSPPFLGPRAAEAAAPPPGTPAEAGPAQVRSILPGVAETLQRLGRFPWARDARQVPALVRDNGRWQYLPCVSFWVSGFLQINIYGDPNRPAAIEAGLINPPADAFETKRQVLEFALSLAPPLALDDRFDRLDIRKDSFAVGDLWFAVSSPESRESPGRWTVLLVHELSLSPSRAGLEELQAISEPLKDATLDPSRPKSWQRGSWTHDDVEWLRRGELAGRPSDEIAAMPVPEWTALGGQRVFVRSFIRERGKYTRSTTDWLRELAANSP